jgi:chromosome partitioning protein
MRGRRRGRNKSLPSDVQSSSSEEASTPLPTGSVTLVETSASPPDEPSRPVPESTRTNEPISPPSWVSGAGTPLKDTISQVATAHAELDHVLPPHGGGPVTIAASTAAQGRSTVHDDSATSTPDQAEAGPPVAPEAPVDPVDPEAPVDPESSEAVPSPAEAAPVERESSAPPVSNRVEVPDRVEPLTDADPARVEPLRDRPEVPQPAVEPSQEAATEVDPSESADKQDPQSTVQSASANPLPRVLAVANQKGGVGKTTTSVNLGAALAEIGFRVLVIDLDPQGNATTGLGIDARNFELSMYDVLMRDSSLEDCVEPTSMKNLFVAPATIALAGAEIELVPAFSRELKLKRSIESVIDDFDYVLIDCPPSLGLITVNALAAADEVLVPIQCEYYALEGLSQLMRNVHLVASNLNPKLDISTIVLTMYDARTKLAEQVANEVRLHFGAKVCRSVIPRTVRLSEAPSFGQPITAFDPTSRGAIAYRELAKEVSGGTT